MILRLGTYLVEDHKVEWMVAHRLVGAMSDDKDDNVNDSEDGFKIHKKKDIATLGTLSSQSNAWYANEYDERDNSESDLSDANEDEIDEEDEGDEEDEEDEEDKDIEGADAWEEHNFEGLPPEVFADIPEVHPPMPMPPSFSNKRYRITEASKILTNSSSCSSKGINGSNSRNGDDSLLLLNCLLAPGQVELLIASCTSSEKLNQLLNFAKLLEDKIEIEKCNREKKQNKSS